MNYKGVKDKIHICLYCNKEFTRARYSKKENPKYCSLSCQHEDRKLKSISLFENGLIRTSEAQRRILSEINGYKCVICNISEWEGKKLTLQVDHVDGNPDNNQPSNLRLLCPNCHSLTPTYKGGNKNKPKMDSRSIKHREIYSRK